ncbi:MAG: hypothetical protein ACE1ZH_00180, partial [Gammaproteobacteria bacterium]
QMAQKAEDEGNSWIKKLTTFVKKVGKQDKGEQEEVEETNAQSENSADELSDEEALTVTDTTLLPPETLEDDDDVTIRKEPKHEKSNDGQ